MTRNHTSIGPATDTEGTRARAIVDAHGDDTLSYFALRGTGKYFFSQNNTAFLSYKLWSNVALVGADPIGPPAAINDCLEGFLRFCHAYKLTPCFLGISDRNLALYRAAGLRILKIGEECLMDLAGFDVSKLKRKVRRAERHCVNLGISALIYSAAELPEAYRCQALDVSEEWIRARGGYEQGFSMTLGRFPRPDDAGVRIVLALTGSRVIGFLTLVPVYKKRGWSTDMMRRLTHSPNGLTEFMVIQAARSLQAEGASFLSLNFAALSNTQALVPEPQALTTLRRFCFDNLSWLFQLKSLYTFNEKFHPEWVSRYLAFRDLKSVAKIVMAIIQSESPISMPHLSQIPIHTS